MKNAIEIYAEQKQRIDRVLIDRSYCKVPVPNYEAPSLARDVPIDQDMMFGTVIVFHRSEELHYWYDEPSSTLWQWRDVYGNGKIVGFIWHVRKQFYPTDADIGIYN